MKHFFDSFQADWRQWRLVQPTHQQLGVTGQTVDQDQRGAFESVGAAHCKRGHVARLYRSHLIFKGFLLCISGLYTSILNLGARCSSMV